MTGWIESINELINIGRAGLTFSLSDLKYLTPDPKIYCILVPYLVFCVWDNTWSEDRHDRESDTDSKQCIHKEKK
jgi:hypothetical protein